MGFMEKFKGVFDGSNDIRAGEDKALGSLRRQAIRYQEADEKERLKKFISHRQREESRKVWNDPGQLTDFQKKKVKVKTGFLGKDNSYIGQKSGFFK